VVQTVLAAAIGEFMRGGYAGLRIEEVAARAGVNKTTVYRRWPTKAALLRDALRAMHPRPDEPPPDTGSVDEDLRALARGLVDDAARSEGPVVARVLAAELDTPEVSEVTRGLRFELQAGWRMVIDRGVARGELPPGTDADLVVHTICSALLSRRLRGLGPVDERFIAAVVELVVRGARHGGAVRDREGAV
jgi:AcrR family transcriptional regulator